MTVDGKILRKQRLQLVGLGALFIVPVLASWLIWRLMQGGDVVTTTNSGELIHPAKPLVEFRMSGIENGSSIGLDDLQRLWTYVVFAPSGCADNCRNDLYITRQIRTSVNKDMSRVQRLLVIPEQPDADLLAFLQSEHPLLKIAIEAQQGAFAAQFAVANYRVDGGHIFLLDPLANLMMAYPRGFSWKGMYKDLRKLLKTSQIG